MEERIRNIQKKEEALDKADALLYKLEAIADEWQQMVPDMKSLSNYYSSSQWLEDFESYNEGKIPKMKCGVLSEDAAYNTLLRLREVSIQMMKIAVDIIE